MMSSVNYPQSKVKPLVFSESGKHQRIQPDEILFVQADHVYVKIVLTNGRTCLFRCSMDDMLRRLPGHNFLRVHRSYIINTSYVLRWDSNRVFLTKGVVPMSRSRAKEIKRYLLSA